MSKTHRSSYSTWEFVYSLNTVVKKEDVRQLNNACFFSLLLDESNDISITKNLMDYVQFINYEKGTVEQKLSKNLPLQQCDALALATAVIDLFASKDISFSKLIMLTTDGAPVMLGCNSGVQVLLKEHAPQLIEYHCIADWEALAISYAYKSVQYFLQLESVLQAIYFHFSHSSVRIEK